MIYMWWFFILGKKSINFSIPSTRWQVQIFFNPFLSHSNIKVFKKMLKTPNSHKLLLSLLCEPNTVDKVTLIYTLYIIDLKKNLWENHVTIWSKQKRTPTRWKRSVTQVRSWSEFTPDRVQSGWKSFEHHLSHITC